MGTYLGTYRRVWTHRGARRAPYPLTSRPHSGQTQLKKEILAAWRAPFFPSGHIQENTSNSPITSPTNSIMTTPPRPQPLPPPLLQTSRLFPPQFVRLVVPLSSAPSANFVGVLLKPCCCAEQEPSSPSIVDANNAGAN